MQNIKRDIYLQRLKDREQNGLVKIVTGIRRCGKSYLLNTLFYEYLKEKGVKDNHIIKISLDDDENSDLLLPKALSRHVKNLIVDDELYYVLLDEIQLADNFVGVLNGLLKLPNVDIYVTGSNSKFLSTDIVAVVATKSAFCRYRFPSLCLFIMVHLYRGGKNITLTVGFPLFSRKKAKKQK